MSTITGIAHSVYTITTPAGIMMLWYTTVRRYTTHLFIKTGITEGIMIEESTEIMTEENTGIRTYFLIQLKEGLWHFH